MSYKLTVKNSKETFIKELYENFNTAADEFSKLCRYYRCSSQDENLTGTILRRSFNTTTSITVTLKSTKKQDNGNLFNS